MSEEDDVTKVKVVFVGEAFTGKTAIIQRVIYDTYEDNMVTTMVASNYSKVIDFEGNHSIRFEIWDTAGQEKYRSINKIFYKDAAIVIMVYDISNRRTFEEIKNYWINQVKSMCNKNPIIGLAGNKSDLYAKEEVKEAEAKAFAKEVGAIFQLTSCVRNAGINELIKALGEKVLENEGLSQKQSEIELKKQTSIKKDKKCCK